MKILKVSAPVLAIFLAFAATPAQAIDLKVPSFGGAKNTGAPGASAADVARNTRNALHAFALAEIGLANALGDYNQYAAQMQLLEGMKKGDAAAKKDEIETLVNIHKSAGAAIEQKVSANAKLSADSRTKAAKSMVEYLNGLVATKNLLASLQGVSKNPMSLTGGDGTAVLYAVKEIPGLVSGGASTTTTLFKYLGANGVDLSEAKAAAAGMDK